MCSYILDHNKMLASTMQHSTHNHTPTHHDHHHHNPPQKATCSVRRSRPGAARKNTQPAGVLSGPNSVPNPGTHVPTHELITMFHPATPTRNPTTGAAGVARCGNSERRTSHLQSDRSPHHTVRLLRKEVIQPHLPVRLPCYDFVPIASPTFDNSLPQAG